MSDFGRSSKKASNCPGEARDAAMMKDLRVPMRDGAVLLTDRYAPRGGGDGLPVVLIRGPYGCRGSGFFGRDFAERGHGVLLAAFTAACVAVSWAFFCALVVAGRLLGELGAVRRWIDEVSAAVMWAALCLATGLR